MVNGRRNETDFTGLGKVAIGGSNPDRTTCCCYGLEGIKKSHKCRQQQVVDNPGAKALTTTKGFIGALETPKIELFSRL